MDPFEQFESSNNVEDPAAEFLAREQAELEKIENNGVDSSFNFNSENNDFNVNNQQDLAFNNDHNDERNDTYSAISSVDKHFQEPEKIKKWREEQRLRITTKDAEEEKKKTEWREQAKRELEDWYKNRQEQLVKTLANNKVTNKATEAELKAPRDVNDKPVLDWDKVTKQCEFNPKANKNAKDVSRMRSILLQLKQQPLVR